MPEIEALKPNTNDRDFEALARSVKEYIKRNEPETGLDRLHTFVVRYVRNLCLKQEITIERSTPLHSAFGQYVKSLRSDGVIETEMTARILKSNISVLDAFNKVRNEHSQAHDNTIVSYHEALLIFNNVVSMIRYLDTIEKKTNESEESKSDFPF